MAGSEFGPEFDEFDFDTAGWQVRPGSANRNLATPQEREIACDLLVLSSELPLCSQRIIDGQVTDEQWGHLAAAWEELARRCRACAGGP